MFEPRKIYPTGKSELEQDAFNAGLRQAREICGMNGINRRAPIFPHIVAGYEIYALDANGNESREIDVTTYWSSDPNNPCTNLGNFPKHDMSNPKERARFNALLSNVAHAQKMWRQVPLADRVRLVRTIAQLISDQMWLFLGLMALEGGKRPFPNGVGEFIEIIDFCNNAADMAEAMYSEPSPTAPDFMCDFNGTVYEPKGVIVDIEPFNFAQAIPMDKVASALVTGNAIIMKASGHTPLQAYMIYRVIQSAFDACGLENKGVVNFLSGHGADMARFLLENEHVTGFTFTGSYDAYWSIQRDIMSKPRPHGGKLQEIAAETSGCNALIVAEDADVDAAVDAAVQSLINNNGQTCSHLGHLILSNRVADEFYGKFVNALSRINYGDVKNLSSHCGALISADAVERCTASISKLVSEELVEVTFLKTIPSSIYAFDFAPRIMEASKKAYEDPYLHQVRSTEIFGMTVTMWYTKTREDARRIFESGRFGLTGGIFTKDPEYALDFALNYRGAAQKYVNTRITGATVGMAFGGSALSGSSGDGVGASTRQALGKYVSHVNVAVKYPTHTEGLDELEWRGKFALQMPIAYK